MKCLSGESSAKINLTLDVFPKNKYESFHRIKTIYHKIDLYDELELMEAPFFSIEGLPLMIAENLIYKAFELIHTFYPKERLPSVKVKIKKNIPLQGGLAGGSSNFAAFIKIYMELFELGPLPESLIVSSAEYGKDIPFFFSEKNCALGTHFGDTISALSFDFSGEKLFLFVPDFGGPTAEMYAKLNCYGTAYTDNFLQSPSLEHCGNTFNVFLQERPYAELIQNPKAFHLAGSGSSFFSFDSQEVKGMVPLALKFI